MKRVRALVTALIILMPGIACAEGATLFISPETRTPAFGDTFTEQVLVDTSGATINAAEADISFDPSVLEVENVSADGSICNSWPTPPEYSNIDGTVRFTGWASVPYAGAGGQLLTITFKAIGEGATTIKLSAGAVLEAGSAQSDILSRMRSATLSIHPRIEVPSVPPTRTDRASSDATSTSITSPSADAVPIAPETAAPASQSAVSPLAASVALTGDIAWSFAPYFAVLVLGALGAGHLMHRYSRARKR